MEYLATGRARLRRADPRTILPECQTIIVVGMIYNPGEGRDEAAARIAAYARGDDYHDLIGRRLEALGRFLQADMGEPVPFRAYTDTGPILEREMAQRAGLGWIGKNTCILNQRVGSWLFLGVILTSLELEPSLPAPDRCGKCTRCIDACPTHALIAPYQLDSNRCISYLTIEKRGIIPKEMREGMGGHVFGCDICQDVCPWNRKAPVTRERELHPERPYPGAEAISTMTDEAARESFRGTALLRAKPAGLRRNAMIFLENEA